MIALEWLCARYRRRMTELDLEELGGKVEDERARTVKMLREVAVRLERVRADRLCDVLPTVTSSVEELARRV